MNISVFRAIRTLLFSTLILGLFVVFGVVNSTQTNAAEGINERINFQGRLLTHEGATVPDGYYNVQFKIYQDGDGQSTNNSTGSPAGTLEWTEEWLNDNSQGVKVRNGYFSVELGSVNAFGSQVDWNQDTLWLSINVGDTNTTCTPFSSCNGDGEMLPMKRLSSTPYALNAGKLGGRTADGFIQNNAGTPQAANISIQSANAGDVAAVIQGATAQTADIFQIKADSVATPLLAVSNIGSVTITPTADTSPALTVNSTTGTIFSASSTGISLNEDATLASDTTLIVQGSTAFQKGTDFSTAGSSNDVDFGSGTLFRLSGASAQTITGIAGGSDGRMITLVNAGTNSATIANDSASSIATNRIITGTGGDLTLTIGSGINLIYDSGASLWRVVGSAGGAAITLQDAYDNSGTTDPQIQLDGTNGGIKIQDASSTVGDILQVQDDTGTTTYFAVTADGVLTTALDATTATSLSIGAANATNIVIGKADGTSGISLSSSTITAGDGADDTTLISAAQTATDTNGNQLIIQGSTGNGTGDGGVVAIQGGAGGAINGNGGNLVLSGGSGTGTGVDGLVVLNTPTFSTTANDANCYTGGALVASSCTIALASVNSSAAIIVGISTSDQTVTLPDPTLTTAGRVAYVTAASNSQDFALIVNGGGQSNEIAMRANTTATMIWSGSDWTAAGASSSTTLQAAYNNTLSSAGGAEIVLNNTPTSNGLTVRNSASNAIIGGIFEAQSSIGSNLFGVNNNATEFATNGGAETLGASASTFPTNTWDTTTGGTVDRWTTTGDNIATGAASVRVQATSVNHGARNRISAPLTSGLTYSVSFAVRGATNFNTLDVRYSPDGTTSGTTQCTTAEVVTSGIWTRVNCTFIAGGAITDNNSMLIRQTDGTTRTFYIDNLSITINASATYAADGSVDNAGAFATNWTAFGAGSVASRDTAVIYDSSASARVNTTNDADRGIRNNLAILPATNTQYLVSFYARAGSGDINDLTVRYSRDGGTNFTPCVDYNTQAITTSGWTKITCLFTTDSTTASNADLVITQATAPGGTRAIYVDALSITLNTNNANNVQIGGANKGGPTTLLTLDRSDGAPIAANNEAYLGSMYYDTTTGRIQCYEADGWGACGSAPDNIVNLSPEYAGAVLNGSGVGTMTADLCANESGVLQVNNTLCDTGESKNFYRWTSPQATQQTYSIYVSYQLPTTFKSFSSDDTVQLTARVDNTTNAAVTYEMFRSEGGTLTQCGSGETAVTTSANTWQTVGINGNEATGCGFNSNSGGAYVLFKINVKANSNANAFVSTLSFVTTGK